MNRHVIDVGQDSFLDIVANLVGVLIILVVVVGANAKSAWQEQAENENEIAAESLVQPDLEQHAERVAKLRSEIEQASDVVSKLRADNENLEKQVQEEENFTADMTDHRHAILLKNEMLRQQMDAEMKQHKDSRRAALEIGKQKASLAYELSEIQKETAAITVSYNESTTETIDHYPNPIAETVFSQEVHFRLERGKLAYVPMDELISAMKSEWRVKAEKLQQSNQTRETVGPIQNFRMQYELEAYSVEATRESAARRAVQFKRFMIHPVDQFAGEPVSNALADSNSQSTSQSQWRSILDNYKPSTTTVSIWVYPDSFNDHAQIKKWLHENGFKMASWPLKKGRMISGGPDGFRTSAQ